MAQTAELRSRNAPYLCAVEMRFQDRNAPGSNVHLTARFSDDVLTFGPIRIRVALARAYMNFKLRNCEFPLAGQLEQVWPIRQKTKIVMKKQSSLQESGGDQLAITASANPSLKLGEDTKTRASSAIETKSEFATTWQHVFWRGTAEKPSLIFDCKPSRDFLSGTLLSGELVGSLDPKHPHYYEIALELEIPKSGLLIEDGGAFTSYPNKRGLVKMIAALALCRRPIQLHERLFTNER